MDDLELAQRLATSDQEALDRLISEHHSAIYRFLRHLTRNVDDAEDLAQHTLLRAILGAGRYDGRAALRTWLMGIAFREFTRWRRRRLWLPLTVDSPQPGDDFDRLLEAEALLDALTRLSEGVRAAFLMHYVECLSIEEVASSMNIPVGTVKSRLHSARKRLSVLLGGETNVLTEPC